MPLVNVTLAAGAFAEQQKHDLAARLTDVMVAFEGSEAFREVVWVLNRRTPLRRLAHRRATILRPTLPDRRPRPLKSSL
jgi:hypothetical protein